MSNIVLTGNLDFLSLGDILQLIGSQGSTGVLRILSKYTPEPGLIYFEAGNIVNASASSSTGVDILYSFFGWTEAEFEFSQEAISVKRVINETRMAIIMDGLRMLDDGSVKKLGPVSVKKAETEKIINLPVIKGQPVDYIYVAAEEEFTKGQVIVQENTYGDWIWAILEGTVDIFKETPRGPLKILSMGEGGFIGTIDSFLFKNCVRTTTAVAANSVQLGVLNVQRLTKEYATISPQLQKIIVSLDKRLRQVSEKIVEISVKESNVKEFVKDKKRIMKQGNSEQKNFFIITEGEVSVVKRIKSDHILLANLNEDDFIGHIPFSDLNIGHEPVSASVLASEGFKVSKPNIESLVEEYSKLSPMIKIFIKNIAASISAITKLMCYYQNKG